MPETARPGWTGPAESRAASAAGSGRTITGATVGSVFADIETFQGTLTASGLPPVLSGRHDSGEFQASVVARDLGPLELIELVTPEGECFRDARCARAADEELWQIDLLTRGRARVEQGRGTADLGPADLVLIDPARPVRIASTAATHVTMLVSPAGAAAAPRRRRPPGRCTHKGRPRPRRPWCPRWRGTWPGR